MAVQNLVEQTIGFISPEKAYNQEAIFSNSLIQTVMANSIGGDVLYGYQNFANLTNGSVTESAIFLIKAYVTPAFQAIIQQNIGTLQAQFPQYILFTSGVNVQFGS